MKKFLAVVVILLIAVGALIQFAVPFVLKNYLRNTAATLTNAQKISLVMDSMPNAKISFGYVDDLHCTADNATIGEIDFKQVSLDGKTVHVDIMELISPTQGISPQERTKRIVPSAESLSLSGLITEEALANFIAEKVNHLKDPTVKMTPDGITASAKVKILGREADVTIGGKIIARDGDLYFQMLSLNVENAILRRVNLDKFFGDFNLTEKVRMPFGLQFSETEMREGETFVVAKRN
ncbi:MAG: hypothetical protein K6G55_08100 [Selenomonadaceae bacterium]|nr:hypothetical protein [Selenomonadaceae bacterium]